MKATDIMTRDLRTVTADSRLEDAARLMRDADVGLIPVVDGTEARKLVGVISDRDIAVRVVAEGRDPAGATVREAMSGNVRSCTEGASVDEVMELMGRERIRRVPIVDERGALVGIVAQADIVTEAPNDGKSERTIEKISRRS